MPPIQRPHWVLEGKRPLDAPGMTLKPQGNPETVQRFVALFALPTRRERAH